jgi:hypothetical protein
MLLLSDAALIERHKLQATSAAAPPSISETCLHSVTSISLRTTNVPQAREARVGVNPAETAVAAAVGTTIAVYAAAC